MNLLNEKSELRWNADIGMFCIDRSRLTCKYKTIFCDENCFNNKLYPLFKDMITKDKRNDKYWLRLTGCKLAKELNNKRKQTDRVRFMARGEALANISDIDKVVDICKSNKNRTFWLPTRAWRDNSMKKAIEQKLFKIKNLRLLASIDPSNKRNEINQLIIDGWSTMFFGNDDFAPIENSHKCAKTWKHIKDFCPKCKNGCFTKKQNHIWLKMH